MEIMESYAWSDGGGGFPCQHEVQPAGGVCVWARADSPATLHSPAITAPINSISFNGGSWIRQGKMGKSNRVVTHGFFPIGSRFDIPPLSLG